MSASRKVAPPAGRRPAEHPDVAKIDALDQYTDVKNVFYATEGG